MHQQKQRSCSLFSVEIITQGNKVKNNAIFIYKNILDDSIAANYIKSLAIIILFCFVIEILTMSNKQHIELFVKTE